MLILPRHEGKRLAPMKKSRALRTAKIFALLAAAMVLAPAFACGQSKPADRHTIVISVDGMAASRYSSPLPDVGIPNILRLKSEGSFAQGVEGIYPSVTYPSHTTIVTGRLPAEHGVYTNVSAREPGEHSRHWFWFAKSIKVPTLWDEARRAGLTTAAVSWPVTAGAPIDWNFPEIWDPAKGELMDFELIGRHSTPGLLQEVLAALHPQPGMDGDDIRAEVAAYVLKKYKPNLLLLHLNDLDHYEHESGPDSAEARMALEQIDFRIGKVLAAMKDAGLAGSTDVFIVSDHGFLSTEKSINPNVLLAKAGLLTLDDKGNVSSGKVYSLSNGGSFFIYWPEGQDLRAEVNAALKPLFDQGLLWATFDRAALAELGVEPAVQMALEPPAGYLFGSRATGDLAVTLKKPGGAHGQFPYRKGLEASFIAWGPHIKSDVDLHRIPMTAVGPTILKAMGIDDSQFGGSPMLGEVFK
jgi:predicted AlkP superfamily pyrophosphatase or phosphodiesterase